MTQILLVDDTKTVLLLEGMLVQSAGFETVTAADGMEAIASVKRSPPDLIVMDIAMPVMDGIEACRILKANPQTKQIPIVMLTTMGDKKSIEKARAAGCDDYITKPVQKQELIKKIKALLVVKR
jgi:Response regulators consisting of a CheY-like receiver domain and a winged-helix DNA-binding domain